MPISSDSRKSKIKASVVTDDIPSSAGSTTSPNYFNVNALTAPLSSKEGLTHAVLQSILNHGGSTENDRVRMGNNERGGCWSSAFVPLVGSRDWTLRREKLIAQTPILARQFYEDALAWLVSEHIVSAVSVLVYERPGNALFRVVTLTLNDKSIFKVEI